MLFEQPAKGLQIGDQVCVSAEVTPAEMCGDAPGWNGAVVSLSGACVGDSAVFTIKNTGSAPNSAPCEFRIVEDQIVLLQGTFRLRRQPPFTERATFSLPADAPEGNYLLEIFDALGRRLHTGFFKGGQCELCGDKLPSGLIFWRVSLNGKVVASGMVVGG